MLRQPKPKLKSCLRKKRIKRQPLQRVSRAKVNETDSAAPATRSETPKKRSSLKFAGPIKIIVVDPRSEYCKTVWCAIGIALTNVVIGAVLMATLHYALSSGDSHAIVCCFGYHFFTAEAILALHYANGWSAPMRTRHIRFAHIFLHVCGIVCVIVGTAVVIVEKGITGKPHGIIGIVAGAMILLSAFIGPFAFHHKRKSWVKTLHMSVGIPAFITSSICVCLGFALDSFKTWADETVVYILICFVTYYTVFLLTSSFMKCVTRTV